jgi:hypothetical protein
MIGGAVIGRIGREILYVIVVCLKRYYWNRRLQRIMNNYLHNLLYRSNTYLEEADVPVYYDNEEMVDEML